MLNRNAALQALSALLANPAALLEEVQAPAPVEVQHDAPAPVAQSVPVQRKSCADIIDECEELDTHQIGAHEHVTLEV